MQELYDRDVRDIIRQAKVRKRLVAMAVRSALRSFRGDTHHLGRILRSQTGGHLDDSQISLIVRLAQQAQQRVRASISLSPQFKRALETEVRRLIEQQSNPSTSDGTNRIARRRARRRRAGRAQRPSMATMLQGGRAGEQRALEQIKFSTDTFGKALYGQEPGGRREVLLTRPRGILGRENMEKAGEFIKRTAKRLQREKNEAAISKMLNQAESALRKAALASKTAKPVKFPW